MSSTTTPERGDAQFAALTGFQRDVLVVCAGLDEPSGQDVKAELERVRPEEVNHGRLYPNLDTLVHRGLVEKGAIDKRTNSYGATDRGLAVLRARRAWENRYLPAGDWR